MYAFAIGNITSDVLVGDSIPHIRCSRGGAHGRVVRGVGRGNVTILPNSSIGNTMHTHIGTVTSLLSYSRDISRLFKHNTTRNSGNVTNQIQFASIILSGTGGRAISHVHVGGFAKNMVHHKLFARRPLGDNIALAVATPRSSVYNYTLLICTLHSLNLKLCGLNDNNTIKHNCVGMSHVTVTYKSGATSVAFNTSNYGLGSASGLIST